VKSVLSSHVSKFNALITLSALSVITTSLPVTAVPPKVCVMTSAGSVVCGKPVPSPSSSDNRSKPSSSNRIATARGVTWELKQCVRQSNDDISCSFSLTTTDDRHNSSFSLGSVTKITDRQGHEYFASQGIFVDNKAGAGSYLSHEVQKGSTYDVSIDFAKIPTSVSDVNSLIVGGIDGWGNVEVKFNDVSIY